MKALSIGRDNSCDIVINDNTDIISRRHATLNIYSSRKITIVDQSRNGTYVNGIRISPNVPVPVTRKDIISFAHVAKLDWNVVPKLNSTMRYVIMGLIGALVIVCGLFAYIYMGGSNDNENGDATSIDTIQNKKREEKNDLSNIEKKQDTLTKDSVVNKKQKPVTKENEKSTELPPKNWLLPKTQQKIVDPLVNQKQK